MGGHSQHVVRQYQDLLRNVGSYTSILTILKLPLPRTSIPNALDAPEDPERCALFQKCYSFLSVFCAKHPVNQELVFSNVDLFFSHVGTEGLDVAGALNPNPSLVTLALTSTLHRCDSRGCQEQSSACCTSPGIRVPCVHPGQQSKYSVHYWV